MADKNATIRVGHWTINVPPGAVIVQRIRCNALAVILAAILGGIAGSIGMGVLVADTVTEVAAQRDQLLEILSDRETLAGRMDCLETALHGGCPVGEARP